MTDAESAQRLQRLLAEPGHSDTERTMWSNALAQLQPASDPTADAIRAFQQQQESGRAEVEAFTGKTIGEAQAKANPLAFPTVPGTPPIDESEQGVSMPERFVVKNLAANPDNAVKWLRQKGYEAYTYTAGEAGTAPGGTAKMRIAVKKPEWDGFKVVDPEGFDMQDISDLFGDLIFGGATQAMVAAGVAGGAAAGSELGPPGMAAGGAAGGMLAGRLGGRAMEGAREGLGNVVTGMFGQPRLNPEPSQPDIENAADAGMAAGPAGEAIGAVARPVFGGIAKGVGKAAQGVSNVVGQLATRLATVSPQAMAKAVLMKQIALKATGEEAAGPFAQRVMQFLSQLDKPEFETMEHEQARTLLTQHGTGQVQLAPILQEIYGINSAEEAARRFGLTLNDGDSANNTMRQEARALMKAAKVPNYAQAIASKATIPVDLAETLKRASAAKANYGVKPLMRDVPGEAAHGFLASLYRDGIENTLPTSALREQYGALNDAAGEKLGLAKQLRDRLISKSAEEVDSGDIVQDTNRAEQFFRTLLSSGSRTEQQRIVSEFGRKWGPELQRAGLGGFNGKANLAAILSEFGAVESGMLSGTPGKIGYSLPGLSFGGRPLGASLGESIARLMSGAVVGGGIGLGGGYLGGADPQEMRDLALLGAGGGIFMATPKGSIQTVAAAKAVANRVAKIASGTAAFGSKTAQAAVSAGTARTGAQVIAGAKQSAADFEQASHIQDRALKALSGIASEVREMAAKNPNFTQEQMLDEFKRRADDYMKREEIVLNH